MIKEINSCLIVKRAWTFNIVYVYIEKRYWLRGDELRLNVDSAMMKKVNHSDSNYISHTIQLEWQFYWVLSCRILGNVWATKQQEEKEEKRILKDF